MDEYMPTIGESRLLGLIDDFLKTSRNMRNALDGVVALLAANFKHFTWTGIYLYESGVLKLGPYRGEPSPHTTIELDKGICGAAFREKQTIIVDDVNADPRFLACSLSTRSEIVVPIFDKKGNPVGEIDIDSDIPAAFSQSDKAILEKVAARIGEMF
ncbi:MAG: GAF domain-containing protein [candidate division Zixibacteria bacterium]|nr:GAF domain-containing protein [candidate division Zixibacteria bacterium]